MSIRFLCEYESSDRVGINSVETSLTLNQSQTLERIPLISQFILYFLVFSNIVPKYLKPIILEVLFIILEIILEVYWTNLKFFERIRIGILFNFLQKYVSQKLVNLFF